MNNIKFFIENPSRDNLLYLQDEDINFVMTICETVSKNKDDNSIFIEDENEGYLIQINKENATRILNSLRYKCDIVTGDCKAKYDERASPLAKDEFKTKEECRNNCKSLRQILPEFSMDNIFWYVYPNDAYFEIDGIYMKIDDKNIPLDPTQYQKITKIIINSFDHAEPDTLDKFENVKKIFVNTNDYRSYYDNTFENLSLLLASGCVKNAVEIFIEDGFGPRDEQLIFDLPKLERLVFGTDFRHFNISLNLPKLKFLKFGYYFNSEFEAIDLSNLTQLIFGYSFNKRIDNISLPELKFLRFGDMFNSSVRGIHAPKLECIVFGNNFHRNYVNLQHTPLVFKFTDDDEGYLTLQNNASSDIDIFKMYPELTKVMDEEELENKERQLRDEHEREINSLTQEEEERFTRAERFSHRNRGRDQYSNDE